MDRRSYTKQYDDLLRSEPELVLTVGRQLLGFTFNPEWATDAQRSVVVQEIDQYFTAEVIL
jgi:hypothetical protein